MMREPLVLCSIGMERDAAALDALVCNHPLKLVHGCAHAFLASFPFSGRELVYSDPPYLQTTRRSARHYRFDSTEADPVALPDRLKQLPCQVMVSGYASALYDAMPAGWCRLALQVVTQGVVRAFTFAPDRVHCARCAGRNVTDCQRIKRKAANRGRCSAALPPRERLAVLSAMMAVEAETPLGWTEDPAASAKAFAG